MINVYKFELFDTFKFDSRVFTEVGRPNRKVEHSFRYIYRSRDRTLVVPVPKNIEVVVNVELPHKGNIDIRSLVNTITDFTFEDKVYLHPDCTIPRAKVTQKYTRVLKADKANICVVPTLERKVDTENIAIFINRNRNKIYISENILEWDRIKTLYSTAKKCANFSLGSRILDINPSLLDTLIEEKQYYDYINTFSMSNWKDFLESSLIYYGPVIYLSTKESWIIDVLYNKLHNIITEDKLLSTLGDVTNEFTKETYDNLREMLTSSDSTVVGLGLKAIAEMDYKKYKNTTIHLLANNIIHWNRNNMRHNSSVKYMLKYLRLWGISREYYASTTTQEDFALMQEVVESDFREQIETVQRLFYNRFPFAKLDFTYQVKAYPRLDYDNHTTETDRDFNDDCDNKDDL